MWPRRGMLRHPRAALLRAQAELGRMGSRAGPARGAAARAALSRTHPYDGAAAGEAPPLREGADAQREVLAVRDARALVRVLAHEGDGRGLRLRGPGPLLERPADQLPRLVVDGVDVNRLDPPQASAAGVGSLARGLGVRGEGRGDLAGVRSREKWRAESARRGATSRRGHTARGGRTAAHAAPLPRRYAGRACGCARTRATALGTTLWRTSTTMRSVSSSEALSERRS